MDKLISIEWFCTDIKQSLKFNLSRLERVIKLQAFVNSFAWTRNISWNTIKYILNIREQTYGGIFCIGLDSWTMATEQDRQETQR